ncbi:MAG: KdsC family phosphatase [Ignavibacteria bacterium]
MTNYIDETDFSKISFILMDMDGVLTDGSIIYSSTGEQTKIFSAYDGYGIERGHHKGLKFAIITGKNSDVNKFRAKRLKIDELYQGTEDKLTAYEEIKKKYNLGDESFCFIGDDVFDLPLLKKVSFSCAPVNAIKEVREQVDYVTEIEGGKGAVREVIDLILKKKNLI